MKNRSKSRKRQRDATPRKHAPSSAFHKRPSGGKRYSKSNKARFLRVSKPRERINNARDRSLHALADMRHGATLSQAARDRGVTRRTIKKYVGSALLQNRPGGRIRATKNDRFVRYLKIPGPHGPVDIKPQGSKQATEVAKYKAAVTRFLGGDVKALAPWRGKRIAGVGLVTDPQALKRLAKDELLPYSLYRSLSGGAT